MYNIQKNITFYNHHIKLKIEKLKTNFVFRIHEIVEQSLIKYLEKQS